MSRFTLNYNKLFLLDSYLRVKEPDRYDAEIEYIVENFWRGIGEYEELFQPFFTTYLQCALLRQLYIYYFSLSTLKKKYEKITVTASTVILDVVGSYLGIELLPQRSRHDKEFFQVREYLFSRKARLAAPLWKRKLRTLRNEVLTIAVGIKGVDVIYFDAGKLKEDFERIPKSFSATLIEVKKSKRMNCDIETIIERVRKNIREMRLSIPNELVLGLLERRVFAYLPDVVSRIGALAEFIEKHSVRLVIVSAITHEDHLCLLAAAKLTGTESLVIPHGYGRSQNSFLDNYATYQATVCEFERRYAGAIQFPLRMSWFDKKI